MEIVSSGFSGVLVPFDWIYPTKTCRDLESSSVRALLSVAVAIQRRSSFVDLWLQFDACAWCLGGRTYEMGTEIENT